MTDVSTSQEKSDLKSGALITRMGGETTKLTAITCRYQARAEQKLCALVEQH